MELSPPAIDHSNQIQLQAALYRPPPATRRYLGAAGILLLEYCCWNYVVQLLLLELLLILELALPLQAMALALITGTKRKQNRQHRTTMQPAKQSLLTNHR